MNTLTLTPTQQTRLERVAQALGQESTSLLAERMNDFIEEMLEDLEDIAIAQERRRQLKTGEVQAIPWEVARAELLAMDDMQDLDDEEGEE